MNYHDDVSRIVVPLPTSMLDELKRIAKLVNKQPEFLASIWIGAAIVGMNNRMEKDENGGI